MTIKNRAIALLLSAAVLSAVILSVVFIAKEADHDCTGENCPICHEIKVCVRTLALIGAAVTGVMLHIMVRLAVSGIVCRCSDRAFFSTPILQKVRLND
ncbi:MAG TPA: hypothetical protein PKY19_04105 [Oscillospiraceae bacterium]|nr:hypothetical protein [Oscillospiraceae bacterium]HXK77647.1 hypothetical protein [Oscillospiraceae bacterium]